MASIRDLIFLAVGFVCLVSTRDLSASSKIQADQKGFQVNVNFDYPPPGSMTL